MITCIVPSSIRHYAIIYMDREIIADGRMNKAKEKKKWMTQESWIKSSYGLRMSRNYQIL